MITLQASSKLEVNWAGAESLMKEPQFRKATRNMVLGYAALGNLIEQNKEIFSNFPKESIGMIFRTVLGELHQTIDFLETRKNTGLARPTVFQNSLHNSTAGFLMISFGLKGPLLTACTQDSPENLVQSLFASGQCSVCVCVEVESYVLGLEKQLKPYVGEKDFARAQVFVKAQA